MRKITYILLLAVVFSFIFDSFAVTRVLGTVSRLLAVTAMLTGLLAVMNTGSMRRIRWIYALLAAFVMFAGVSYVWSADKEVTWGRFITFVQLLGLTWMILEFCPGEKEFLGIQKAFVLGAAVLCVITMSGRLSDAAFGHAARYTAPGWDPNYLAIRISLAVPMAWYISLRSQSFAGSLIWRLFLPLSICAIAITGSRGGLITWAAGSLIVPLALPRLNRVDKVTLVLMVAGAAIAIGSLVNEHIMDRFISLPSELTEGTLTSRRDIWHAGLRVFDSHWLLGIGAGAYPSVVARLYGHASQAHNTFISVLTELGIIGAILLGSFLIALIRLSPRLEWRDRLLTLTLLLAWATGSLSITTTYDKTTWFIFGTVLACIHLGDLTGLRHGYRMLYAGCRTRCYSGIRRIGNLCHRSGGGK